MIIDLEIDHAILLMQSIIMISLLAIAFSLARNVATVNRIDRFLQEDAAYRGPT